ncbi:Hpt domain-containing protein [Sulfuricurvum sp.]|uniref:Hpt domain-containing protein n=1 Tax=Sulfuricurvum sp. TaxID=2025608 RepID=UPI0027329318|nr:Hpt domain-containing protein [Sulfuricurvum sp.]
MMDNTLYIEGIDIKSALGRVAGNEKLLRKLLGRFVETQTDAITRIKTAIALNDLETAIRESHTIKGLAGNFGANTLFHNAETLEFLLREPMRDHLDEVLLTLEIEFKQIMKKITVSLAITEVSPQTNLQ